LETFYSAVISSGPFSISQDPYSGSQILKIHVPGYRPASVGMRHQNCDLDIEAFGDRTELNMTRIDLET
jgi:hypothetical protein